MSYLNRTIQAIQFIAKPAVRYTTKAVAYTAQHAVPRTKKVIDTWNYEWARYPGQRPSISAKAPTSSEEPGDVGMNAAMAREISEEQLLQELEELRKKHTVCNICTGPYVDGACTTYKCWR
tara:strand:+ start:440 stop:802 length:363 start_codon:yes stop_codon:yes gene_type:complete